MVLFFRNDKQKQKNKLKSSKEKILMRIQNMQSKPLILVK